jgi:hypothetical protein
VGHARAAGHSHKVDHLRAAHALPVVFDHVPVDEALNELPFGVLAGPDAVDGSW